MFPRAGWGAGPAAPPTSCPRAGYNPGLSGPFPLALAQLASKALLTVDVRETGLDAVTLAEEIQQLSRIQVSGLVGGRAGYLPVLLAALLLGCPGRGQVVQRGGACSASQV